MYIYLIVWIFNQKRKRKKKTKQITHKCYLPDKTERKNKCYVKPKLKKQETCDWHVMSCYKERWNYVIFT